MSALGFELQEKLTALQSAILAKHPTMPTLLQDIHRALKLQPENVTLMSEEEIAIVVSGLQAQTQVSLVKEVVAKKATTKSVTARFAALGMDAI